MNLLFIVLTSLVFTSCSIFKNRNMEVPLPHSLEEAISSTLRSDENKKRDTFQHPLETLKFFGIKANMTVVEITPGAGYYTEILAEYLARKGQYAIVVPRMRSRPSAIVLENEKKIQEILLRHTEVQNKTRFIAFEPLNSRSGTKPESADMVLTFNSVHNWMATKSADFSFKLFYDLLKPGGVLGVVQHRIAEGKKNFPKSGYMTEKEVINLARKAGFKFFARSEINANPKDTADYPHGVWTLPPTFRLGDNDRERYEEIGESDKMTLKFIKPMSN